MIYSGFMKNAGVEKDLRVRLRPGLKERFDEICLDKRISQVDAVNELVAWFNLQDDMLQSIIWKQVKSNGQDDVARLVLDRVAALANPAPAPTATSPTFDAHGLAEQAVSEAEKLGICSQRNIPQESGFGKAFVRNNRCR